MFEHLLTSALTDFAFVPLQSCSSALDFWGQGNFFDALNHRVALVMGMAAFMMIVGVTTFLALQWWSKSYVVPATVLVLTGGVFIRMMPAPVARIGWIVILPAPPPVRGSAPGRSGLEAGRTAIWSLTKQQNPG